MNKRSPENPTLAVAIAALAELGIKAHADLHHSAANRDRVATLTLQNGRQTFTYETAIKRHVGRALLGPIAAAFAGSANDRLLVTDHITPPLAEELRGRGIQFVDTAGNAFLRRPGLFVFVTGRRPPARQPAGRTSRIFRPSGLKVTFALLSVPRLVESTQREIARAAGVALGSVPAALDGLRELGFLDDIRGARRLLDSQRLVRSWTEAYVRVLEPTLEMARFSAPEKNWWRHTDPTRFGAQWGGETAAAILRRHLVPERVIAYADRTPNRMLSENRLKADAGGNVVIRRRFWRFDPQWRHRNVVPPLLVYADLVAAADSRSLQAAEQIRSEYLDGPDRGR